MLREAYIFNKIIYLGAACSYIYNISGVSSVSTPNLAVNPTPLHVNNVNPSTPLLFNSVNPPTLEKVSVANFITPGFAASNRVFAIPSIKVGALGRAEVENNQ